MKNWLTKPRFNGSTLFVTQKVKDTIGKWGEKYKVEYFTKELPFYDDGFIFANEFLDVMNKRFGTNYPFNDSYKNEKGKKHNNLHSHWNFEITSNLELLHHYYFDGDSTNFIGLGGIATATFGCFTEEEFKQIADALVYYNQNGSVVDSKFFAYYYDTDARKTIQENYSAEIRDINNKKQPMIDALKQSLEGDLLEDSINRINSGFYWTERGARDRMRDNEYNEELNEKERILKALAEQYKIEGKIVNNKRPSYCSNDDRFAHNSWINYEVGNDTYYTISVDKYSKENAPTFKIYGEIHKRRDEEQSLFNCNNLSAEELKLIVSSWFEELNK